MNKFTPFAYLYGGLNNKDMTNVHEIIWKPIPGFEGFYEVDNAGRVRGVDRSVITIIGVNRLMKGQLIRPRYDKDKYKHVSLCRYGKEYDKKCHRLVALAFIPNPENKPFVNHLNGIKDDNRVINLEWSTEQENTDHAIRTGLIILNSKRVYQKDLQGNVVKEWPSLASIARGGFNYKQVHRVLYNGRRTHKGFKWEYVV